MIFTVTSPGNLLPKLLCWQIKKGKTCKKKIPFTFFPVQLLKKLHLCIAERQKSREFPFYDPARQMTTVQKAHTSKHLLKTYFSPSFHFLWGKIYICGTYIITFGSMFWHPSWSCVLLGIYIRFLSRLNTEGIIFFFL